MTAQRITVEDLKEKAEGIRDTVKEDARRLAHEQTVKVAVVAVAAVAVGLSIAFYLGTRRCLR
ncbi:MAG: hypothetical protein Kow0056_12740 [Coriobacteriia bacterium]